MNDTKESTEDLAILERLNKDFFHSDQFRDAKRFSEFLAKTSSRSFRASPGTVPSSSTTSLSPAPSRISLCTTSTSASSVTLP